VAFTAWANAERKGPFYPAVHPSIRVVDNAVLSGISLESRLLRSICAELSLAGQEEFAPPLRRTARHGGQGRTAWLLGLAEFVLGLLSYRARQRASHEKLWFIGHGPCRGCIDFIEKVAKSEKPKGLLANELYSRH
jgi:hypothetical protein